MGQAHEPAPVKPLIAVLWADEGGRKRARSVAEALLGPIDLQSDPWPFDTTDYYAAEMGTSLWREFWAFERLASPALLADWKCSTNACEDELRRDARPRGRTVNLDPGYIHFAHVALASTKPYSHRIYLRDGIYAEVTLLWQRSEFITLPWTFPEYRTARVQSFLEVARGRYHAQMRTPAVGLAL